MKIVIEYTTTKGDEVKTIEVADKFKEIDLYEDFPENDKMIQALRKVCKAEIGKGRLTCILTENEDIIWEA